MDCKMLFRLCSLLMAATLLASSDAWTNSPRFSPADSFSGAYLAGYVASEDNNIDIAIDYFRQALSYDPGNTLIEQKLMLNLLATGKFKKAVKLAASLRSNNDIGWIARLALAADSFNRQRFTQAKADIQYTDPDVMDQLISTLLSAWANYGSGNRQDALRQLKEFKGPSWYELFRNYHLALMYDLNGQKKAANEAFQQSIKDQKGKAIAPDTYERIIMAYTSFKLRNNEQEEAINLLKDAETLLSDRNALRNFREQIERGKKPNRLIPKVVAGAAEAIYNVGTFINRAGGEAYAGIYLNIALAMRPDNNATLFQLAELAIKSGQPDQAIIFYQDVARNSPYFRDASLRLSLNLADSGRIDKAITNLNRLVALYPKDKQLLVVLSGIYIQNSRYEEAIKVLDHHMIDQLNTNQKDSWSLFYHRGVAYERLKEWNKAEPNFRKALEFYPEQPEVLNYLGYSLIDRNINLDEALEMVLKAKESRPQDGYIVDSLGWAYYRLGRYTDAVKELEKAVKMRPENTTINDHLGDAYWQIGRKLEATFQWKHALAGNPESVERIHIQKKLQHGLKEKENPTGNISQGG
ncbi:MAG: Tetratricopeptide repeat protein [Candidatus Tokpelaia sp. JSC189]|nr:MAG: Tetratricopeptide repeat protein [Candidatus Tokpelaia sp. JSC189]